MPVSRIVAGVVLALGVACREPFDPAEYNADWTNASHGMVAPNYSVVFPQDSVNRIEIVLTPEQWTGIRQNMTRLWGFDFGSHGGGPCCCPCPEEEPAYVNVPVRFNGKVWKNVGFRLKGNSSLEVPWDAGIFKLPFRLKFDAFEDTHPEVWNQRFYGFKEVSMSTGIFDNSLIREKVAADIFRLGGVPAARTAFYRVYIDFGQGLQYAGLYTMVELPEDTMVRDQFGENAGNLYKPRSTFQTFDRTKFAKENNQEAANYSDVEAFVAALNSGVRTTNAAQWRSGLEATFNVDHFLKWLAINNEMVSWDSYGKNAQNFFLYNHSTLKLTWIPWDQNYALTGNPPIIGEVPRPVIGGLGLSLRMNEVESSWPLIRYLADDPIYYERYRTQLRGFHQQVFTQAAMDAMFDKYHAMVAPYVIGPDGERPGSTYLGSSSDFVDALVFLKLHVQSRRQLVTEFLQ